MSLLFLFIQQGISPVLPIFREGVLNGPQEIKEQAATLLGEVIKLTSAAALKPSVVHITGPLIRILGDRFNWTVKEAILDTLGLLLEKVMDLFSIWSLTSYNNSLSELNENFCENFSKSYKLICEIICFFYTSVFMV